MRRFVPIFFFLVSCASALIFQALPAAWAETPKHVLLGTIVNGIQLYRDADGNLRMEASKIVTLQDGSTVDLKRNFSIDITYAENTKNPKIFNPMDASLYLADSIGSRVKILGISIFGANASSGIGRLPGSAVYLNFDAIPREQLRTILQQCSGLGEQGPQCRFDVEGDAQSFSGREVKLFNVILTAAR